ILTPFNKIPTDIQEKILYGTAEEAIEVYLETSSFVHKTKKPFEGMLNILQLRMKETTSEMAIEYYKKFQTNKLCHACCGARLNSKALQVKIAGLNISEVTNFSISKALIWAKGLDKVLNNNQKQIAERILKEII